MIPAERRLWSRIRARQIVDTRFTTKFPLGPFICDFVSRGPKLIIEVDGGQHAEQAKTGAGRTAYLKSGGYSLIRFWNNDVLEYTEGVVHALNRQCVDRPSPTPPT